MVRSQSMRASTIEVGENVTCRPMGMLQARLELDQMRAQECMLVGMLEPSLYDSHIFGNSSTAWSLASSLSMRASTIEVWESVTCRPKGMLQAGLKPDQMRAQGCMLMGLFMPSLYGSGIFVNIFNIARNWTELCRFHIGGPIRAMV